jgi:hypothetical protein
MRYLKHIKIFEAFKSDKLSKTLGYIDSKRDKDVFLDKIKRICNIIDFPYSELSDEYFEYLPFNSALKKADTIKDEPCVATSSEEFPEYAIAGEVCKEGKIRRRWGSRIRAVSCPVCNGTGVKPKRGEPKLVKFWFNKDGKYIETTCVDGIIRNYGGSSSGSDIPLPQTSSSYTVSGEKIYRSGGARTLQTGQYIHIKINGEEMYAYILSERRDVYAIQPKMNGGIPNNTSSRVWKKISSYSWDIGDGDFEWLIPVSLNNMDNDDAEPEADPYTWNTGLTFNYRGINSNGRNIERFIKDSHFAIVMDFGKLKKSEFQTRTHTKHGREDNKVGALSFMSDDEIKKENIERYIKKLASRLEVDGKDVTNLPKVIKRLLGYRNLVYFLRQGHTDRYISTILKGYILLLKSPDDRKERYLKELNDNIKYSFKQSVDNNKDLTNILKEVKDRLKREDKEEYIEVLDLLSELSLVIYDKINSFELETIEDLEILYQKIMSMKNIVRSDRYSLSKLSYHMDYSFRRSSDYSYRYLTDRYYIEPSKMPNLIEDIKTAMRIIKKM